MENKVENQEHHHPASLLPNIHSTITAKEESPRKAIGGGGSGGGGDRLKRDEWSEGAVCTLLEAYEAKWVLRNRAKLKGQDWEEVAKHVSSRANNTKSPKTQTQCKNKIESMKKRYRSESATATDAASSWPLYSRLDVLLRGTGPVSPLPQPQTAATAAPSQSPHPSNNHALMLLEPSLAVSQAPYEPPPPPVAPPPAATAQNSYGSNGVDKLAKVDFSLVSFLLHFLIMDFTISRGFLPL
uniref:Myb/SANT-like DNA-binding domain-containing protein n=1 Tax=Lotus japonicus TaxID=34305 RepID=I3SIB9_LOTJA|nr:unknown [Lotus japonicus]